MQNRWSIPIDALVKRAKGRTDTVVRRVTLMAFKSVIEKSPVDTGRFRANWIAAANAPNRGVSESTDKSGGRARSAATQLVNSTPVGSVIYLTNSLPYAEELENGSSKQAPGGMVGVTVVEFQMYVNDAVRTR